jgi:sugar phosphate permease
VRSFEKWLTMTLLCLSGSLIFWLPFFSEIFYEPMREAFGFTNTQMGAVFSIFGVTSMLGYFPGGWLADLFSPRRLIASALIITAIGGFIFSTTPPFWICMILYGTWGLTTAFVFWAAMIKATRNWAPRQDQGKAFGFLEGGRNIVDATSTTVLLAFFALRGADHTALSESILILASACLILAVFVWTVMSDDTSQQAKDDGARPRLNKQDVLDVLRLPMVWLIAFIIMAAYCGMHGTIYLTPYASTIYELGDVGGGVVGTAKYWLAIFMAIAAGVIADKIGTAKAVIGLFAIMTAGFAVFALIPGAPTLLPLLIVNGAIVSAAVFGLRGVYYSLLEQGNIPFAVTGTAVGIVSVIAYTPDIFLPLVAGRILDANPGASGYQIFFAVVATLNFLGLVATYITYRLTQRKGRTAVEARA